MTTFLPPRQLSVEQYLSDIYHYRYYDIPAPFNKKLNGYDHRNILACELLTLIGAFEPGVFEISYEEYPIEHDDAETRSNDRLGIRSGQADLVYSCQLYSNMPGVVGAMACSKFVLL